jgi:hypothetical protein
MLSIGDNGFMSSYAGIYINGKEIFTYRNQIYPQMHDLFTGDDFIHLRGRDAVPYSSSLHAGAVDDDEELEVYAYRATAAVLVDRLNLLGFGIAFVRRAVEGVVAEEIESQTEVLNTYGNQPWASDTRQELEKLERFDFDIWKAEVRKHILSKKTSSETDWRSQGPLKLFDGVADERILLRIIVNEVSDDEVVILDVTDLFDGGWLNEDMTTTPTWRAALDLSPGPPIVITEGRYDAHVLQNAVEILKPHLAPYVRFLDYDLGNEGGASAAVKMLKSFASAGVWNRIVAVFDNDSAAYEAVMNLRGAKLPDHYSVMHYPDFELANAYPTLGPQGSTTMNVNRLAGSIELYLGRDVLTGDDGDLTPVQWKGYMSKVHAYQGEVINKGAVQRRFDRKLTAAKTDSTIILTQDWSGLALILDKLIETLSSSSWSVRRL